jgi:hypothetical protein
MRHSIVIGFLLITLYMQARHQSLSLQSALDKKLVKAKVTSLGGFQGFCINMALKNLSKDSLVIFIEPGRRLNSVDDKYQDILIVKQEIIALQGGAEKVFKVKGYCCQASNSSPSKDAKYEVNKLADSNLVMIARYLNASKLETNVEQQAIWAISDREPTAAITSKNDSLVLPLRRLVAAMKGEKLPWYTIVSETYVYPNGVISVFPLLLKGKMEYVVNNDSYITLRIVNEKGLPVCLLKSEWRKASANSDYDLNIPIKGLGKGKYTIELSTENKGAVKKEFEI